MGSSQHREWKVVHADHAEPSTTYPFSYLQLLYRVGPMMNKGGAEMD